MDVTFLGTGVPIPDPARAGQGVLVRTAGLTLLFDAGRSMVQRLAQAGLHPTALDAVFLTHHHTDHTIGLPDLAHTRWMRSAEHAAGPLTVHHPSGPCTRLLEHLLDGFGDDISVRRRHGNRVDGPLVDPHPFTPHETHRTAVWARSGVTVEAIQVDHAPVEPAVGYVVEQGERRVVISGDTAACAQVEEAARGADLLIHEAFRPAGFAPDRAARLASYHTPTTDLALLVARAQPARVALIHLLPPPTNPVEVRNFVEEVAGEGFAGSICAPDDLTTVSLT